MGPPADLSPLERLLLPPPADHTRLIYERAHARAIDARDHLSNVLRKGVPAVTDDAATGTKHAYVCGAVHAYTVASRLLYEAAQMVCDIEELPDDGERHGIVWEVRL